jgi:hypothetical protein
LAVPIPVYKWQKADVFCSQGFKKIVDFKGVIHIESVDDAKDFGIDPELLQQVITFQNPFKSSFSSFGNPVFVVQLPGTVHANSYQEVFIRQEPAPFIVEKDSVGLYTVDNGFVLRVVPFLEFNSFPVKINTGQGGFASMPGKEYRILGGRLQQLNNVPFQQLLLHGGGVALVQCQFVQVIAIAATQVAQSANWFDKELKGAGGGRHSYFIFLDFF